MRPAARTPSDFSAWSVRDRLIEGELRDFFRAAADLAHAAAAARSATRGSAAHAEVCRLAHAAEALLRTPVARPLLLARTSAEQARDQAAAAATLAQLQREHANGDLSTRGD